MATRAIDLEGLPEEDVKAVESFVQSLRRGQGAKPRGRSAARDFPNWPGVSAPPERLRRVEIYKDVD
jgi:hypothetical protein